MTHDPIFGSPHASTPYAGTSGHSGSTASRDRALREDENGTSGHRQQVILSTLEDQGVVGMTSAEFRDEKYGLGHHGNISGALSVLHKDGQIACLKATRNRCHVYLSLTAALGVDADALRPFGGKPVDFTGKDVTVTSGDRTEPEWRNVVKSQFPAGYSVDAAYSELATGRETSRKPILTADERRLVATGQLAVRRFKGANTMPLRVTTVQALLAIIERITT